MYLFIATHLGSGASLLCDSLSKNMLFNRHIRQVYKSGTDLKLMKESNPYAKIHFDKLIYNHQFTCTNLLSQCHFIYVVREPNPTLSYLVKAKGYSERGAMMYYTFRMRRLCEMAKKTRKAKLFTFDDLVSGRAFEEIQKFIGLKNRLEPHLLVQETYEMDCHLWKGVDLKYEKYLSFLKRFVG